MINFELKPIEIAGVMRETDELIDFIHNIDDVDYIDNNVDEMFEDVASNLIDYSEDRYDSLVASLHKVIKYNDTKIVRAAAYSIMDAVVSDDIESVIWYSELVSSIKERVCEFPSLTACEEMFNGIIAMIKDCKMYEAAEALDRLNNLEIPSLTFKLADHFFFNRLSCECDFEMDMLLEFDKEQLERVSEQVLKDVELADYKSYVPQR